MGWNHALQALHLRMLNTVERALQNKHAIKINGTASDAEYLGIIRNLVSLWPYDTLCMLASHESVAVCCCFA